MNLLDLSAALDRLQERTRRRDPLSAGDIDRLLGNVEPARDQLVESVKMFLMARRVCGQLSGLLEFVSNQVHRSVVGFQQDGFPGNHVGTMAGLDIIYQGPDMFERQTDLMASGNVRGGLHESG